MAKKDEVQTAPQVSSQEDLLAQEGEKQAKDVAKAAPPPPPVPPAPPPPVEVDYSAPTRCRALKSATGISCAGVIGLSLRQGSVTEIPLGAALILEEKGWVTRTQ